MEDVLEPLPWIRARRDGRIEKWKRGRIPVARDDGVDIRGRPLAEAHGKSEISVTHREEVVCVVFMTPPYRRSSVYAHTPPMLSRLSSTTVLRPSPRQYLHAIRPDHPAPITITSYSWF